LVAVARDRSYPIPIEGVLKRTVEKHNCDLEEYLVTKRGKEGRRPTTWFRNF